ncbi:MAG TPA: cytochrome c5 family protein [Porticoccaceae bacterium]
MSLFKKAASSLMAVGLVIGLAGCGSEVTEVELTAKQEQAVAERLAPHGEVVMESEVGTALPAAASGGGARSGEEIYNRFCMSCHMTGAAGAPKLGDAEAWGPRIAQGIEVLYTHSIEGFKGMPPRGLCMDCSDEELHLTVDYIVENSQ